VRHVPRPSRIQPYNSARRRYDKLVIAVGSTSSTHGVPGLEHCFQLKTIADAQKIRRRIMGACLFYTSL
jgi:NADH dehydrogenase FAD-containing subunit